MPIKGSLSVFFRIGGEDLFNVFGTSAVTDPFRAGIVAVAVDDETGAPLAGVLIRFRIINDTTGFVAGVDKARLEGEETTFTNTAGEAFNQLRIVGVGEVVIEADLIDPNTNEVVETSNQIIAVTINIPIITLAFGGGATTTVIGPGGTATVTATVTDTTGMPISGAIVRFNITSDSTGGAVLSRMTAATGAAGTASITVTNGPTSPGTVMIEGEVIDSGGVVLATSNTITGKPDLGLAAAARLSSPPQPARQAAAASRLGRESLDAALITTRANVRYLSGFTGTNGWLLLAPSAERLVHRSALRGAGATRGRRRRCDRRRQRSGRGPAGATGRIEVVPTGIRG